jgi:hypothetical protein
MSQIPRSFGKCFQDSHLLGALLAAGMEIGKALFRQLFSDVVEQGLRIAVGYVVLSVCGEIRAPVLWAPTAALTEASLWARTGNGFRPNREI